jgi:SWIM zinc finger
VHRGMDSCAEIQKDGLRWTVNLEEHKCSCRAWQVKGIPCIHAAAFIASIRNAKWENYVHSYFSVDRFKTAYAIGIAPMPSKNEWIEVDLGYKILPPTLKRPAGRPRKNRIKSSDEPKKRSNKCTRCGLYGHYRTTCKNAVSLQGNQDNEVPHASATQGSKAKRFAMSYFFLIQLLVI